MRVYRRNIQADTPSHIMREHDVDGEDDTKQRYTLTYNEGTFDAGFKNLNDAIHPHI